MDREKSRLKAKQQEGSQKSGSEDKNEKVRN